MPKNLRNSILVTLLVFAMTWNLVNCGGDVEAPSPAQHEEKILPAVILGAIALGCIYFLATSGATITSTDNTQFLINNNSISFGTGWMQDLVDVTIQEYRDSHPFLTMISSIASNALDNASLSGRKTIKAWLRHSPEGRQAFHEQVSSVLEDHALTAIPGELIDLSQTVVALSYADASMTTTNSCTGWVDIYCFPHPSNPDECECEKFPFNANPLVVIAKTFFCNKGEMHVFSANLAKQEEHKIYCSCRDL